MGYVFLELINDVISKETPEYGDEDKIIKIIKKTLNFNRQEEGIGLPLDMTRKIKVFHHLSLQILTSKQNVSKIVNSFRKTGRKRENRSFIRGFTKLKSSNHIFFLSRNEITKKVDNNKMNSTKL